MTTDKPKRTEHKSDETRMLEYLREHGRWPYSVPHKKLYRLGLMAHSRASTLRQRGYGIHVRRDGDEYLYSLTSEPKRKGTRA